VEGLTLDPKTRVLWAGTDGRGMWALQLAPAPLLAPVMPSPGSLDCKNVDADTTSATRTVTITNTGAATLTISSISDPGPYFPETNDCGSTLPVGSNCSFQAKLVTGSSLLSASTTLAIQGNMRAGYQVIPLSGTTQDFSVSDATGTISTSAGQPVTATIKVIPQGTDGFKDAISLSCSGLFAHGIEGCAVARGEVARKSHGQEIADRGYRGAAHLEAMAISCLNPAAIMGTMSSVG
jgi:hypothetical protein